MVAEETERSLASLQLTLLLRAWSGGDEGARDKLFQALYEELRRKAERLLAKERKGHTIDPPALVHEVYLLLAREWRAEWRNRSQFMAVAAETMRRVLIDYARARAAAKRGGGWQRITLDLSLDLPTSGTPDLMAVDAAISALAQMDQVQARIVELRFFAGLSIEETAEALGNSPATVKREWRIARAFLLRTLETEREAG